MVWVLLVYCAAMRRSVAALFLNKDSVAFSVEGEGAGGCECHIALRDGCGDGAAVEPLGVVTSRYAADCGCGVEIAEVHQHEHGVVATGFGVGKHVGIAAGEECGGGAVGECRLCVPQSHECGDCVLHLGIGGAPVDFCVVEIV